MRSRIHLKSIIICAAIVLFCSVHAMAGTWTTIDVPGASETWITKIEGSNIVGTYHISGIFHGFTFDGVTYNSLDYPPGARTSIWGIEGSNLVGYYRFDSSNDYHGFLYNGTEWNTIDMPDASSTLITSIDGSIFAGYYLDVTGNHGFLYDGTTWTTLDMPGAAGTYIADIDGENIVGKFLDASGEHGFFYDGTTWTILDVPGSTNTNVRGIDGTNLVGSYSDAFGEHGFIYNGKIWTTFNYPGATDTFIYDIDGSNLVGAFYDTYDHSHGFVYEIPEPATPPIANADGPYTIYVGDTLTLDASGSTDDDNDIASYLWDLDDNNSFETDAGSNAVFDVNYTHLQSLGLLVDNTYNIHLKVTDSQGQSDVNDSTLIIVPEPALSVAVDIKPGDCPNPLNVKSSGVLPVAILGTDDYDVTTIDPTSVRLAGVEPIRSGFEDVAAPVSDSNDCNCITEGPDGFLDLTLKFKTQRIVEAIGDVNDGDVRVLTLTGVLFDPMPFETPIEGADCILIRGRHKAINPADINKDGVVNATDFAIFAQNWLQSSIIEE